MEDRVVSRVGVMKLSTVVKRPVKDTHLISYRRQTAWYRKSTTTHGMLYFCSLKRDTRGHTSSVLGINYFSFFIFTCIEATDFIIVWWNADGDEWHVMTFV